MIRVTEVATAGQAQPDDAEAQQFYRRFVRTAADTVIEQAIGGCFKGGTWAGIFALGSHLIDELDLSMTKAEAIRYLRGSGRPELIEQLRDDLTNAESIRRRPEETDWLPQGLASQDVAFAVQVELLERDIEVWGFDEFLLWIEEEGASASEDVRRVAFFEKVFPSTRPSPLVAAGTS